MATTPTSFRLRPETLAQLDRLAELLTTKYRRRREGHPDDPELPYLNERSVTRAEALAVAVGDTLKRLEGELGVAPPPREPPFKSAAEGNRGLLAALGAGVSLVDELTAERRAEAAAERRAEDVVDHADAANGGR
jgi:hypothetical protein